MHEYIFYLRPLNRTAAPTICTIYATTRAEALAKLTKEETKRIIEV